MLMRGEERARRKSDKAGGMTGFASLSFQWGSGNAVCRTLLPLSPVWANTGDSRKVHIQVDIIWHNEIGSFFDVYQF
jgi:hypothetical protein